LARFTGNALLYTRPDRFLMLADAQGRQLWLTSDQNFCGRSNTALSQGGAWSADGRYLLIACQDDGPDPNAPIELLTANLLDMATGEMRRISAGVNGPGVFWNANSGPWSPKGTTLLMFEEGNAGRRWSIFEPLTGRSTVLLTTEPETGSTDSAAWSPDGSQIAILGRRARDAHQGVYVIAANGSDVQHIDLDDVDAFYSLAGTILWSADGRTLYLNRQLNPSQQTYVQQSLRVDLDTGTATVLPDSLTGVQIARWSPDGKWFLLQKYATADHTIVAWSLYHADGTLKRTFSSDPSRSVEDLAWLPDGRLAFAVNRVNFGVELVIAQLDGQEQVIATRPGTFAHRIAAAPDGSLLAVQLDNHIVVFDTQGASPAEFDGTLQGWRPKIEDRR
jgi:Tol biopolymer transport system component